MPRRRLINTSIYFKTKLVKLLGSDGLHIYYILWARADDWGGYEYEPDDIALATGALKFSTEKIQNIIDKLLTNNKIIAYQNNSRIYHWITNFLEHQHPINPALPTIPLPPWITYETHTYKSGRIYAKYLVLTDKLPPTCQQSESNDAVKINSESNAEPQTGKIIREVFAHLNLIWKTRGWIIKDYKLTDSRKRMIESRLKDGATKDDCLLAINNCAADTWEERNKFCDPAYVFGIVKGKDQFEKWLNFKIISTSLTYITLENAQSLIMHESTSTVMQKILQTILSEDKDELIEWLETKACPLVKSLYLQAKKGDKP